MANDPLKRHYLSLFWERFEIENGVIMKSVPTVLFRELLELKRATVKIQETKNHQLLSDSGTSDEVIIKSKWLPTSV